MTAVKTAVIWVFFSVLFFLVPNTALAGDFHFIANGKAFHFDRDKSRNERNWGAGIYYRFDSNKRYNLFVTANSFKDSFANTSNYIGGGYQWRRQLSSISTKAFADVGIVGFAMTRKNYRNGKPFVGALPFVTLGYQQTSVNFAFIPRTSFNESSLLFMQFMVNFDFNN